MQQKDDANTLPGGSTMRALNEISSEDAQRLTSSPREEVKAAAWRILLVEDDTSLASLEADILTAHGYVVAIAGSGELAVAALRQAPPDLVVLDLQLQGNISGWDVLQDLRTRVMIPVLLTSSEATARAQIRTSGETRSTLDHLPKPYPMHALLKRIKRMLMIAPRQPGQR